MNSRPYLILGALWALLAPYCAQSQPLHLYVSPKGNDALSGSAPTPSQDGQSGPFATLERARDEIRSQRHKGGSPASQEAVIELLAGTYELSAPLELASQDSDTLYRAQEPGKVVLRGGHALTGWKRLSDPEILSQLEEGARANVYCTNLRTQGISDYGSAGGGGIELFFSGKPMTLARWPNSGFTRIADVVTSEPVDIRGTKGDMSGKLVYEGERPARWTREKDLWAHGYWFWDWADQRMKVASIDTQTSTITIAPPHHAYGYRKGQWFYAYNALSELDSPGEWYLDRQSGMLYFWPPEPVERGEAVVSVLPSLINAKDASRVRFEGLSLEATRADALTVRGGSQVLVEGCSMSNLGGYAVTVDEGTSHGVRRCEIFQTGRGGISLRGGDLTTLTPAGHFAEDNHIHHYSRLARMYNPAVTITGVGNRISHNLIHDAPHEAISFGGNDHLIEFNEIHDVCTEANDAGAVYAGRNWTMRGTTIRYNFLHDIRGFEGKGSVGVYLDDMYCGTNVIGNIFWKVQMAVLIGGGRDNVFENNVFVDCPVAIHLDARGLGWASDQEKQWIEEARQKKTHLGIRYREAPYALRYPELPGILEADPAAPRGNRLSRNICVGGKWGDFEWPARVLTAADSNLVGMDPGFVNASRADFRLKLASRAWDLGFQPIPIEQIGPRAAKP